MLLSQGQHRNNRVVTVRLTTEAKWMVRLYSALLALTLLHETMSTRPFVSFRVSASSLVIRFDGCLGGSGVIWYGGEVAVALALLVAVLVVVAAGGQGGGGASYRRRR